MSNVARVGKANSKRTRDVRKHNVKTNTRSPARAKRREKADSKKKPAKAHAATLALHPGAMGSAPLFPVAQVGHLAHQAVEGASEAMSSAVKGLTRSADTLNGRDIGTDENHWTNRPADVSDVEQIYHAYVDLGMMPKGLQKLVNRSKNNPKNQRKLMSDAITAKANEPKTKKQELLGEARNLGASTEEMEKLSSEPVGKVGRFVEIKRLVNDEKLSIETAELLLNPSPKVAQRPGFIISALENGQATEADVKRLLNQSGAAFNKWVYEVVLASKLNGPKSRYFHR